MSVSYLLGNYSRRDPLSRCVAESDLQDHPQGPVQAPAETPVQDRTGANPQTDQHTHAVWRFHPHLRPVRVATHIGTNNPAPSRDFAPESVRWGFRPVPLPLKDEIGRRDSSNERLVTVDLRHRPVLDHERPLTGALAAVTAPDS